MRDVPVLPAIVSFGWGGENKEIKVIWKNDIWMTEHLVDGQPDEFLVQLYGTYVIPTPWGANTDRETVVNELAARNPNAKVTYAETSYAMAS